MYRVLLRRLGTVVAAFYGADAPLVGGHDAGAAGADAERVGVLDRPRRRRRPGARGGGVPGAPAGVGPVPDHGPHVRDEPEVVAAVPGPAGRARRRGDGGARFPVRGLAACARGQRHGAGRRFGPVRPGHGEQAPRRVVLLLRLAGPQRGRVGTLWAISEVSVRTQARPSW